ncbi:MAG: tRNA (adenosine(37)-N6)-threonylcarbamoyltransferase complex ATPase subunit type 1 TsaE [Actinomycetota bacterium]
MIVRRHTLDTAATQRAGEELAGMLRGGDVVVLSGPLGAGKTTFVQGVARGLGVEDRVTSPTFTVVREHRCTTHPSIRTLHHVDLYRTNSRGEIIDLALGELVEEAGVALIEWGELAGDLFGADVLSITIRTDDDESRHFEIEGQRVSDFSSWGDA